MTIPAQWILLLLLVWALFRIGPLNFGVAWLVLRAPWGRSTSAQLWALDQGLAEAWFTGGPLAAIAVRWLRVTVDFIAWAAGRHQENHCKVAYEREAVIQEKSHA
jgi:hypothetical protein